MTQYLSRITNPFGIIGSASGWGAGNVGTGDAPDYVYTHLQSLLSVSSDIQWVGTAYPPFKHSLKPSVSQSDSWGCVNTHNYFLSYLIKGALTNGCFPIPIGGDHSMAVSTWSTITEFFQIPKQCGLIWIDAHMDAHTPTTSHSQNLHGMPVAALLGEGNKEFVNIINKGAKFDPQHIVLVGVRSYETGEHNFLKSQNVKIYYMEEVHARGLREIFLEIKLYFHAHVSHYGISLDLDAFDPEFIPGVGTPAPHGLHPDEFLECLNILVDKEKLRAFEITEFNPHLDKNQKTITFIQNLIKELYNFRKN